MKTGKIRELMYASAVLCALALLPLAGIAAAGKNVSMYLEFPPLTRYVEHAGFSWPAFIILSIATILSILPFVLKRIFTPPPPEECASKKFLFPWWGWTGTASCAVFWILSWTRFSFFSALQPYTFAPLWISYTIVINALTFRRSGRCMMTDRTSYFLALFPASAVFWWFFEYLNRFAQNWYYVGTEEFTPFGYFILATLSFSTVLPAVSGTWELLKTYPRLSSGLDSFPKIRIVPMPSRLLAAVAIALFSAGLALIGIFPDYFFPLLWLSPLVLFTSVSALTGQRHVFSGLAEGKWAAVCRFALAALICGFFWEMWNFHSAPKWEYIVPFVGEFRIFEMPVLGYAGYLPFGLECAVIAGLSGNFFGLNNVAQASSL